MNDPSNVKDIVEEGLGSIGKIKILRALAEEKKLLTVYKLHKKTHLKREDIKRNLSNCFDFSHKHSTANLQQRHKI